MESYYKIIEILLNKQTFKIQMRKYIHSFLDGMFTGMDPLGCIAGHITKKKIFFGYIADQYSFFNLSSLPVSPKIEGNSLPNFPPKLGEEGDFPPVKSRNLDEIVFKAIGDVLGITANVASYGLLQLCTAVGGTASGITFPYVEKYLHEKYLQKRNITCSEQK